MQLTAYLSTLTKSANALNDVSTLCTIRMTISMRSYFSPYHIACRQACRHDRDKPRGSAYRRTRATTTRDPIQSDGHTRRLGSHALILPDFACAITADTNELTGQVFFLLFVVIFLQVFVVVQNQLYSTLSYCSETRSAEETEMLCDGHTSKQAASVRSK